MKTLRILGLMGAVAFLGALPAAADITNGSFENGSNGWIFNPSDLGTIVTSTKNADNTTVNAAAGTHFAVLTAGSAWVPTELTQSVTVKAGDKLTYDWYFSAFDNFFNDWAFSIDGSSTQTLADVDDIGNSGHSAGWQTGSYTFTTGGTFTVGFGVQNDLIQYGSSKLFVDSVSITSAPEPSSILLLVVMGLAVGLAARFMRPALGIN